MVYSVADFALGTQPCRQSFITASDPNFIFHPALPNSPRRPDLWQSSPPLLVRRMALTRDELVQSVDPNHRYFHHHIARFSSNTNLGPAHVQRNCTPLVEVQKSISSPEAVEVEALTKELEAVTIKPELYGLWKSTPSLLPTAHASLFTSLSSENDIQLEDALRRRGSKKTPSRKTPSWKAFRKSSSGKTRRKKTRAKTKAHSVMPFLAIGDEDRRRRQDLTSRIIPELQVDPPPASTVSLPFGAPPPVVNAQTQPLDLSVTPAQGQQMQAQWATERQIVHTHTSPTSSRYQPYSTATKGQTQPASPRLVEAELLLGLSQPYHLPAGFPQAGGSGTAPGVESELPSCSTAPAIPPTPAALSQSRTVDLRELALDNQAKAETLAWKARQPQLTQELKTYEQTLAQAEEAIRLDRQQQSPAAACIHVARQPTAACIHVGRQPTAAQPRVFRPWEPSTAAAPTMTRRDDNDDDDDGVGSTSSDGQAPTLSVTTTEEPTATAEESMTRMNGPWGSEPPTPAAPTMTRPLTRFQKAMIMGSILPHAEKATKGQTTQGDVQRRHILRDAFSPQAGGSGTAPGVESELPSSTAPAIPPTYSRCLVCHLECRPDQESHMKSEHGSMFMCPEKDCWLAFWEQQDLSSHQGKHGKTYKCSLCWQTFDTKKGHANHKARTHHSGKGEYLAPCGKTFIEEGRRDGHICDSRCPKPNGRLCCTKCAKKLNSVSGMITHMRNVHRTPCRFTWKDGVPVCIMT